MQLFFLTRDWKNDYPRIGWLPSLPEGAARLWEGFNEYGWQQSEYPQMILEQHGGVWQLFVSGQDSGRTDSPTGVGRRIRVTFYLTGSVSEAQPPLLGWLGSFLRETLNPSERNRIQEILLKKIPPEAPTEWSKRSPVEQKAIANDLCKALCMLPVEKGESGTPARWFAGAQRENLPKFLGVCEELLAGRRNGMAFSLTYLGKEEVAKANRVCARQENLAILLSNGEERQLPLTELSKPLVANAPHTKSRSSGMTTRPAGQAKSNGGFLFGGSLAVVMAILLFCALRCHSDRGKQNPPNPMQPEIIELDRGNQDSPKPMQPEKKEEKEKKHAD